MGRSDRTITLNLNPNLNNLVRDRTITQTQAIALNLNNLVRNRTILNRNLNLNNLVRNRTITQTQAITLNLNSPVIKPKNPMAISVEPTSVELA